MTRASAIVFDLQAGQNRAKLERTSDQRPAGTPRNSILECGKRRIYS